MEDLPLTKEHSMSLAIRDTFPALRLRTSTATHMANQHLLPLTATFPETLVLESLPSVQASTDTRPRIKPITPRIILDASEMILWNLPTS